MSLTKSDLVNRLEHTWILQGTWLINDPTKDMILDDENLLILTGPQCAFCDETYRAEIRDQKCPLKTPQSESSPS